MNHDEKMKKLAEIFDHCLVVADAKGRDYSGTDDAMGNFQDFGWTGIIIRIGDKYHRLKNIIRTRNISVIGEGILDTLHDVINYAALAIIQYRTELEEECKKKLKQP